MISKYEHMYASLVDHVLQHGELRKTRNAMTIGVFGKSFTINTGNEIPLLSARKLYYKGVFGELAAMFRGPNHIADFRKMGCNFWDTWADKDGSIRVDYGNAWRNWNGEGIDQLADLKKSLVNDPTGRRHIITGWNPSNVPKLSLPCCHLYYQWYVSGGDTLEMIWSQRSVDLMIGLPSNVIAATTWNNLLANELGLKPGAVTFMLGDVHIYESHLDGAQQYLKNANELTEWEHKYPPSHLVLDLKPGEKTEDFMPDRFIEKLYEPMKPIKFELLA